MRLGPPLFAAAGLGAALFLVFVPVWDGPGKGRQVGLNGPSLVQYAPTGHPLYQKNNAPPPADPPLVEDKRPASQAYKNVKVLGDIDAGAFMRLQYAITNWVAPQQGCGFCHDGADFSSDAKPAKETARSMLKMVRHINADWKEHVGEAGVTCWSCHRGQPVPAEIWFKRPPVPERKYVGKRDNWNEAAETVRQFFPEAGWELYLLEDTPGLAQSYTALPSHEVAEQVEVKRLYEYMMQMSSGIGVNCTYCHNSRAFYDWNQSLPARWKGDSGIRMTREINREVLLPLMQSMPQTRTTSDDRHKIVLPTRLRGTQEGNGFADCATCHYGLPKPASGAGLFKSYPGLTGSAANEEKRAENAQTTGEKP